MESLKKLQEDVKKFRARASVAITNYTLISTGRFESRRKKGSYYAQLPRRLSWSKIFRSHRST